MLTVTIFELANWSTSLHRKDKLAALWNILRLVKGAHAKCHLSLSHSCTTLWHGCCLQLACCRSPYLGKINKYFYGKSVSTFRVFCQDKNSLTWKLISTITLCLKCSTIKLPQHLFLNVLWGLTMVFVYESINVQQHPDTHPQMSLKEKDSSCCLFPVTPRLQKFRHPSKAKKKSHIKEL